jgi:hypothetical protein
MLESDEITNSEKSKKERTRMYKARFKEPSTFAGLASVASVIFSASPEHLRPYAIFMVFLLAILSVVIPETTVRIASEMAQDDVDEVLVALIRTRNEQGERAFVRANAQSICPAYQLIRNETARSSPHADRLADGRPI